jgi:nucleoside-triphosphatase THEP1
MKRCEIITKVIFNLFGAVGYKIKDVECKYESIILKDKKLKLPSKDIFEAKVKEIEDEEKIKENKKIINNETELKILDEIGSRDYQAENSRYALDMALKKINGGSLTNDEETKLNIIIEQNNKISSILLDGRERKKQLETIKNKGE